MQVSPYIHTVHIPFEVPVAPGVRVARSVSSCIVFGDGTALIDSGVSGAEAVLFPGDSIPPPAAANPLTARAFASSLKTPS